MTPVRNNIIQMSGRTASPQMLKDYVIDKLQEWFPEPGSKVVVEHQFHPHRKWRFDVAITPAKVALEFQGAVWTGGHHTRGPGYVDDARKMLAAAAHGWMVLYLPIPLLRDDMEPTLHDLEAAILCRLEYVLRAR
jgi:hypothetical protein